MERPTTAAIALDVSSQLLIELEHSVGLEAFLKELNSARDMLSISLTAASDADKEAHYSETALDAIRSDASLLRAEDDEQQSNLHACNEDCSRLRASLSKAQIAGAHNDLTLRDSKARLESLRVQLEVGSDWRPDQSAKQHALNTQRIALTTELDGHRGVLMSLRLNVNSMTEAVESVQAQKNDAERALANAHEDIASAKNAISAGQRAKSTAEFELTSERHVMLGLRVTLAERQMQAEAAAGEASSAQEAQKTDRADIDGCAKGATRLKSRAVKLVSDMALQQAASKLLESEVSDIGSKSEGIASDSQRAELEAERQASLTALAGEKLAAAERRRADAESRRSALVREQQETEEQLTITRKAKDSKHAVITATRREREGLRKAAAKAGDRGAEVAEAMEAAALSRAAVETQIGEYQTALLRLRGEISALKSAKAELRGQCEASAQAYFTAVEGLKLQELQHAALERRLADGRARLKQQQTLYDAAKLDRTLAAKRVGEAQLEIGELRRRFRSQRVAIDKLKDDITVKDQDLVKEHFEHHKVEKEKEGLRHEVGRLAKQVTAASHIITQQESEVEKLNAIISDADSERGRQAHELGAIVSERNLLQAQLVQRDEELAGMYEKLRVQRSSLANGAASFAGAVAEREALTTRIGALRGALALAQAQTSDVDDLEAQARALEVDVLAERTKVRSLQEELSRPINIHRWRSLQDVDPARWALLRRVHELQGRLSELSKSASASDAAIAQRETELAALQRRLARVVPKADIHGVIAAAQDELSVKAKHLRRLVVEVEQARGRVSEHKAEIARVSEAMDALSVHYVRRRRAEAAAAERAAAAVEGGCASKDAAPLDANALLTLSVDAELAAAKLVPDGHGGTMLPSDEAADAKRGADALLSQFAHLLG